MTLQIEPFFSAEYAALLDVIAVHLHLADVSNEGRLLEQ